MSKIKASVLSALIVMALSAVASSSASAVGFELTSEKCEGPIVTACYALINEGTTLFELAGEEETLGTLDEGEVLLSAVLGEEVHINCTIETSVGVLLQPAKLAGALKIDKGILTFKECKLLEPLGKKCTVPAELKTKEIAGTFPTSGETEFKPEAGTVFIEIPFTNNGKETCPATIKGTQAVTGSQICTNTNPEVDLTEHLQACEPSGSKLKLGGSAAEFLLIQLYVLENNAAEFWSMSKG